MIKGIFIIAAFLVTSFIYSDFNSDSFIYKWIFPIVTFISTIALGIWLVALFKKLGIKQVGNSSGDFGG